MANIVEYDATGHDIDAVTVFQTNRAEINRSIKLDLKDGQNEVEVKNLPTCIDQDSIRVDGIGNAVILDVIYHAPEVNGGQVSNDTIRRLHNEKQNVQAQISILNHQSGILQNYSKTLSSKETDTRSMESFLDVFATRQTKIDESLAILNRKVDDLDKQISNAMNSLISDIRKASKCGINVTVVVQADGDGEVALSLTYVVSKAWWKPQYDLRTNIAPNAKSKSSVRLHYKASIVQQTGEDWSGVALTLSTAAPLQGTSIPILEPLCITNPTSGNNAKTWRGRVPMLRTSIASGPMPVIITEASRRSSRSRSPRYHRRSPSPRALPLVYQPAVVNDFGNSTVPPPGFFQGQDSSAADGAVSTTFTIPGRSSIPSGADANPQTHKVSIAEISIDSVELEWVTVPKTVQSVFLRCKIQNTSKYVLLPGSTNIFLNNSFVAKSNIPHVNILESFSCSLGADPGVKITYYPQSKKTKTSNALIGSKSTAETFQQSITIKNTRQTPIPRLILKENIHTSRDDAIKVNVLEPKELNGKSSQDTVQVKKGVKAGWAQQNNDSSSSDGRSAKDHGFIDFICEIGAGDTLDIDLGWEIVSPPGVNWVKE